MAATITVKCRSRKEEKSWQTDEKGKALNRVTFEFNLKWVDMDDPDYKMNKKFDDSTFTLSTTDKKVADSLATIYKLGQN